MPGGASRWASSTGNMCLQERETPLDKPVASSAGLPSHARKEREPPPGEPVASRRNAGKELGRHAEATAPGANARDILWTMGRVRRLYIQTQSTGLDRASVTCFAFLELREGEFTMRYSLVILGAVVSVAIGTAQAEPDGRPCGLRQKMLEKFDADGDGVLNEAERQSARQGRAQKMIEEFDTDSDGKLDEDELVAALEKGPHGGRGHRRGPRFGPMHGHMPPGLIGKFDTDGDGKLSEEERDAAHKAMQQRRQQFLEKFDTDKDGALSKEEREAVRKTMAEKFGASRQPIEE